MHITYAQDGCDISDTASGFALRPGDTRFSKRFKQEVYDFVGFLVDKDNMLAVFPKHYFSECEQGSEEDICLLFDVITKYISTDSHRPSAEKYMGYQDNFESDYPFMAFFEVYDYYKKYGLYREEELSITKGQRGKVSWRTTIQKSNVVVSHENLIFTSLYSQRRSPKAAFIGECMTYVINHTISEFSSLIHLPPVRSEMPKMDLLANRDYVLRMLRQCKAGIFKDAQKKLLNSLITFFEQYGADSSGGPQHIKIHYFDFIWQEMIDVYLNSFFLGVDEVSGTLIFDPALHRSPVSFTDRTIYIDDSVHGFKLVLDHYAEDDRAQFIFDSKYYDRVSELNYKQFSYGAILGNPSKKTYNALLLPGKCCGQYHLKLKTEFSIGLGRVGDIIEQFLDMKTVMEHYVSS